MARSLRGIHGKPATLVAFLLALCAAHSAARVFAQQHPATGSNGLESFQIRPNVHVIFGAGGNVTVRVGEDGLVVVDTGSSERASSLRGCDQDDLAPTHSVGHQHQR